MSLEEPELYREASKTIDQKLADYSVTSGNESDDRQGPGEISGIRNMDQVSSRPETPPQNSKRRKKEI